MWAWLVCVWRALSVHGVHCLCMADEWLMMHASCMASFACVCQVCMPCIPCVCVCVPCMVPNVCVCVVSVFLCACVCVPFIVPSARHTGTIQGIQTQAQASCVPCLYALHCMLSATETEGGDGAAARLSAESERRVASALVYTRGASGPRSHKRRVVHTSAEVPR